MKERFNLYHFYEFIEDNDGSDLFKEPVKETCTLEFESGKGKFSINLDEDDMKQLVGECVKAFGLKAVIIAASEADDDDEYSVID